ncbi:MAG TPA: beta-ketoacyl-[acyl-carrier-protein] synthase II [Gammaproteobacteria bacterium]|jgi:3-oxoacyl-[acyl-carrier-protein] synthase II|nr:beta-ketoacyl-[acyl-carrier-protein] synthase II [Gammaproteobacteria bacterium]|tara:strand:+ start:6613 stop:7848 length:1236 start_codon:yes stop_codon:yes gene_type:complete
MTKRRVVVTGMGMISPIGHTVEESWQAAVAGCSGIGLNESFDTTDYAVKICGSVRDFDISPYMNPKEARRIDDFIQLGIAAAAQAIQDAGLESHPSDADRIGVAIGSGIGGINTIESTHDTLLKSGPRRVSPFFVPGVVINMISGNVSIEYGFKGPNIAVVTACTTGTHNIGFGARMIQYGDADVMVVGGAEAATSPITVAGFASMRALSSRNDEPEKASRPWDEDRDGFVLGEGAGVLVLEEYERAKARGAQIYGEVLGFGMSADAFHITGPAENGEGGATAMRNALKDAELNPDQLGYLNAHGTSTPLGDVAETKGVKSVFGDDTQLMVSSTKSMIGHLLGAAGSVEAIFTLKSLQEQVVAPTINLENPGEGCDLDYVPNQARDVDITSAASNSFGFGGTNGTLVFGKI